MLTRTQRIQTGMTAVAASLLIALLCVEASNVPRVQLAAGTLSFDASAAMRNTAQIANGYPNRVTGTAASRSAAAYVAARFRALGYHVERERFGLWYGGNRVEGENVVATLPHAPPQAPYVAVTAHYDSPKTSPYAAEDDASGVGTLLELARIVRGRIARPIFAATDAEEIGMLGARRLAGFLRTQGRGAAISIDYVNAGAARGLEITASGQFRGYTPLWLRELATAAQRQQSAVVGYPSGLIEWLDRAVGRSFQDQGPLLSAGIPAVNLATIPADKNAAMSRYHTPRDRYANFTPDAFAMLGRSAERLMLTLARRPAASGFDGFLLAPGRFITLAALWWMQILALAPLVAALILAFTNVRAERAIRALGQLVLMALPPAAAYALVAPPARSNLVLPRYELYPPPPKDPLLFHPPVLLLVSIFAVFVAGYALVRKRVRPLDKPALFIWTIALLLAAFAIQPFGAWVYLGVFGYGALFILERPGRAALAANLLLLTLSALPFAGILWYYAAEMRLGPFVLWYLVLQAAYGTWPFATVALAMMAGVLWVQFVRLALTKADAWIPSTLPKPRPAAPMSGSAAS